MIFKVAKSPKHNLDQTPLPPQPAITFWTTSESHIDTQTHLHTHTVTAIVNYLIHSSVVFLAHVDPASSEIILQSPVLSITVALNLLFII